MQATGQLAVLIAEPLPWAMPEATMQSTQEAPPITATRLLIAEETLHATLL